MIKKIELILISHNNDRDLVFVCSLYRELTIIFDKIPEELLNYNNINA